MYYKKIVAIYCRLSEEDRNKEFSEDESRSIQNQKNMLIEYAEQHEWEIYDIYCDDDYTGISSQRPDFQRLLKDAEKGNFGIILCKSQARFSRDMEVIEKYLHRMFPLWGIRFVSLTDNADTEVKGNKKSRQINALVNEWYLEDLSNNVRAGLTAMRKKGMHIGGIAPYGYLTDPLDSHHLVVDQEVAWVVRKVFELYVDGYGIRRICTYLNERNIPSPSQYKIMKGINWGSRSRRGTSAHLWKYQTVRLMLHNEMYIGNMVQGKHENISYKVQKTRLKKEDEWIVVKNTHEAIISQELWNRVQGIPKGRVIDSGKRNTFAGKVRCMYCGYAARLNKSRSERYYLCSSRTIKKDACEGCCISEKDLVDIVKQEMENIFDQYFDIDEVRKKIVYKNDRVDFLRKDKERHLRKLAEEKEKLSKAKVELYIDKSTGKITFEDYAQIKEELESRIVTLDINIKKDQEEIMFYSDKITAIAKTEQILTEFFPVRNIKLNYNLVDILIESISVGKREKRTEKPPVEIKWKF